jgi:hypothetical protein
MNIVTPANSTTATATETLGYVTLAHAGSDLTLPTLARPGNYTEVVYLADGVLQFEPGANPVIAATLAFSSGTATLTLCPLPDAVEPSASPMMGGIA